MVFVTTKLKYIIGYGISKDNLKLSNLEEKMSEIYNPQAFAEGEQKANTIKTRIDALLEKSPAGFGFEVVGKELRIYAPYSITFDPGDWSERRKDDAKPYSYIQVENLYAKPQLFDEQLQRINLEIARLEHNQGYAAQLQKLFPSPVQVEAQPAPKPEPVTPKLTPEQEKENRVRRIEERIAEEGRAVELANTLNLTEQVKAHEDELAYLRNKLAVVQAGYERVEWDESKYSSGELEKYIGRIPLFALEALQTAQAKNLFDDFRVWTEQDGDPVLVGRIISSEHKTPYLIEEWS